MINILGYIKASINKIRCYYIVATHPGLSIAGKAIIGDRVQFIIDKGGKITCEGDITIQDDTIIQVRENATITLGHRTYINRGCSLVIHKGLEIGKEVMLGENVKIYDNDHKIVDGLVLRKEYDIAAISIKDRCWIANHAVVLKGTNMGPDTVISALSLASGNLDSNALYMGVPCRKMKKLERGENN